MLRVALAVMQQGLLEQIRLFCQQFEKIYTWIFYTLCKRENLFINTIYWLLVGSKWGNNEKVCGGGVCVGKPSLETTHRLHVD